MNTLVEIMFKVAHRAGRAALVHDWSAPARKVSHSRPRRSDRSLGAAIADDMAGWRGADL